MLPRAVHEGAASVQIWPWGTAWAGPITSTAHMSGELEKAHIRVLPVRTLRLVSAFTLTGDGFLVS